MASYKETFSAYYDALTEDVDRAVIADRCEELLAQYHPKRELALDLCCGTGTLATELARRGFEVIGVDASPEMLMQAAEKNMALERPVLYLCQPLERLDLYGTVDLAVCTLDSLNHLPGKKALQKALHRLQFFVEPGGLFLFDVNTPYKHREVLGNNCFVRESEALFAYGRMNIPLRSTRWRSRWTSSGGERENSIPEMGNSSANGPGRTRS